LLTHEDLFDIVSIHRLHFDHTNQTGIVLHMISGIASSWRFGLTAIGDMPEQADAIYQRFIKVIDQKVSLGD
jgi:hypothetical protein